MRIEASKQVINRRLDNTPANDSGQGFINHDFEQDADGGNVEAPPSRALVSAEVPSETALGNHYRQAAFLAHLIATKEQAPQTRERRRATPGDAVAAYRAMAALTNH